MNEYCDHCKRLIPAVGQEMACESCGFRSTYSGRAMTIKQALRALSANEKRDKQMDRSISERRRHAREIVKAGWAWNYRRAIQMLGQDWGIRIVW